MIITLKTGEQVNVREELRVLSRLLKQGKSFKDAVDGAFFSNRTFDTLPIMVKKDLRSQLSKIMRDRKKAAEFEKVVKLEDHQVEKKENLEITDHIKVFKQMGFWSSQDEKEIEQASDEYSQKMYILEKVQSLSALQKKKFRKLYEGLKIKPEKEKPENLNMFAIK